MMATPDEDLQLQLELARARRKRKAGAGAVEGSMSDFLGGVTESMVGAVPDWLPGSDSIKGAVAGGSGALASLPEGIRQLFNSVTGDTQELDTLKQETSQRKEAQRALVGDNTTAELVGTVGGTLVPGIGAARALEGLSLGGRALSSAGMLNQSLRTGGAGAIGGAAGGATQALEAGQGEEERATDALVGSLLGGAFGAVAPPLLHGAAKVNEWRKKIHPLDALTDFTERAVGVSRGTDRAAIVSELRKKAEDRIGSLKKTFDKLYAKVEKNPNLPEIPLAETYLGQGTDPALIETLGRHGSAARVLKLTKEGAENPTVILGANGQPLSAPHRSASFEDVSRTRKYLRDLAYKETDPARKQVILGTLSRLDEDLSKWAASSPEAKASMESLDRVDGLYRDHMGPLVNRGEPIGDWNRAGFTERKLDTTLLGTRTGAEAADLSKRIPGSREPARQYYASKALSTDGRRELLRSNSTRDTLFSPSEREYMDRLADALRKQEEEGVLVKSLEAINQKLGSPLPMDRSVLPYGQYPMAPERRNVLADIIRGWMGSRAVTTEG